MFDNGQEISALVADDSSQSVGILGISGADNTGGGAALVFSHQCRNRTGLHQRRITCHDQDRPVKIGQQIPADHYRMSGAQLLGLKGESQVFTAVQGCADQFSPIPNHGYDSLDAACRQGIEHIFDHGPAANGNKDLGQIGFHPRAFAGSHDNSHFFTHRRSPQVLIITIFTRSDVFSNTRPPGSLLKKRWVPCSRLREHEKYR